MVRVLVNKVRPGRGFSHLFHYVLVMLLPVLVYLFVRLDFNTIALLIILLSKWRMFAVRPRHWLAHVRTNAVDIIASLSFLTFMVNSNSMSMQLLWLVAYEIWVLYLKPGTTTLLVGLQALIAQFIGLTALFIAFQDVSISLYVIAVSAICYFCSRHFFTGFNEENASIYSWIWAFFGGSLAWLMGHWLLFYGPISQTAVFLSVIGYGLVTLYFLDETDRLSTLLRRQVLFVIIAVIIVMIAFSNWGDNVIK